jgi:hypothetical protein
MPQETILKELNKRASAAQPHRAVLDAPSLAPDLPYTFENGASFNEPAKVEAAFIPDRGFDGPA